MRVNPDDKRVLERAAEAAHLNVTAFVLSAALSQALELLAERDSVRLTPAAAASFREALDRPAAVNERLARALQRRRKFTWVD